MDNVKNIAAALAKAQLSMGAALKDSTNPHFHSKYADLSSVVSACSDALNENGIAFIQPSGSDEKGNFVDTILIHGESGETLESRIHLKVEKSTMQGMGSAITYARRYGLMGMAGIAPEDDDGNGAGNGSPKKPAPKPKAAPKPNPAEEARKAAEEAKKEAEAQKAAQTRILDILGGKLPEESDVNIFCAGVCDLMGLEGVFQKQSRPTYKRIQKSIENKSDEGLIELLNKFKGGQE